MFNIKRLPTTPGQILKEDFLKTLGLTQIQLAKHIGCDVKVINRIINNKTSITAEMAIKLSDTFNTTPDFWLNAQYAVDIYRANKNILAYTSARSDLVQPIDYSDIASVSFLGGSGGRAAQVDYMTFRKNPRLKAVIQKLPA